MPVYLVIFCFGDNPMDYLIMGETVYANNLDAFDAMQVHCKSYATAVYGKLCGCEGYRVFDKDNLVGWYYIRTLKLKEE